MTSKNIPRRILRLSAAALPLALAIYGQSAGAAALHVLHTYANDGSEGYGPNGFVLAADGNFYGTTSYGGTNYRGVVLKMAPDGTVTTLYNFPINDENGFNVGGYSPIGKLVPGNDGNFYGVAIYGGANGTGTVFKLTPDGVLTTVHDFTAVDANYKNADGTNPYESPVKAADGSIYGSTSGGGTNGHGTIFRVAPDGSFSTLQSLDANDYSLNQVPLTAGPDGNVYGVNLDGGANNGGAIMRITPAGTISTIYSFAPPQGGGLQLAYPDTSVTFGADGALYGHAVVGGASGIGGIYRLTLAGQQSTIYSFSFPNFLGYNLDGIHIRSLLSGSDGNLYGATDSGGAGARGGVFKLTPSGTFSVLYTMPTSGYYPTDIVDDGNGNIVGTTGVNAFKVVQGDPLTTTLSIDQATVAAGTPITVTWNSTGASSCVAFGNVSGPLAGTHPTSGSITFTPKLIGRYFAGMDCSDGNGGASNAQIMLTVRRKGAAGTAKSSGKS